VKSRLGFLSGSGAVLAAVALAAILGWTLYAGAGLFSAGSLSATSKGRILGGVSSHSQLDNDCNACHTAPWSGRTMADRCLVCHTPVANELRSRSGMHGWLLGTTSSPTCAGCHPEHNGPDGVLTDFNHDRFAFKLVGKHATLACSQCHISPASLQDFRATPQGCFSCHGKDDTHKGAFGTQCGQCHTAAGWANAKFDHTIFPVDHGRDQQTATCQTCHPVDFAAYTCFGCHRHTEANVLANHEGRTLAQLVNCIQCHPQGRQADN
jgi:hypothetical protein